MEACSLVTKEEVEAALGETVSDGTSAPANQPTVCNFTAASGKQVGLVVYSPGGATMMPMMMPQPVDVPGIGDKAAWYGMGRIFGVLKGDTLVTFQFVGYTEPDTATLERAKSLATAAAGRF